MMSVVKLRTTDQFSTHPPGPALAVGDNLILRKTDLTNSTAGWSAITSNGATVGTQSADLAPDTQGHQSALISASGAGQFASLSAYFDTAFYGSFVQLNGTYRLSFKAKGAGGAESARWPGGRVATIPPAGPDD